MQKFVSCEIEDSQCDACGIPPEGHRRMEEERCRVEEWNARIRKRRQEEKMKLNLGIVAGEVVGCVQRIKCTEC